MENNKGLLLLGLGLLFGVVVAMALRTKSTDSQVSNTQPRQRILKLEPVATNEETWDWVDWRGRERKLVIHRMVNSAGR